MWVSLGFAQSFQMVEIKVHNSFVPVGILDSLINLRLLDKKACIITVANLASRQQADVCLLS